MSVFITAFSSFVPSQCPHYFYESTGVICAPTCPGSGGCLLGAEWCVACPGWVGNACSAPNPPAELQTHTWPFPTNGSHHCSRDFNELAAFLQSSYLPPAAPRLPLPVSSLPAPILAAPRQRERGIIYCVPVENERLLHFNEH